MRLILLVLDRLGFNFAKTVHELAGQRSVRVLRHLASRIAVMCLQADDMMSLHFDALCAKVTHRGSGAPL